MSMTTHNTPKRDAALDATRTIAIWLMVVCHTARLMPKSTRPDWFNFGMLIEPLCQALFLAMVGVSLVYSKRIALSKGKQGWAKAQIKRALELYGISLVFFLGQQGWQWPWVFISSGILLAIGCCILFFIPFVAANWNLNKMVILGLVICGLSEMMDAKEWLIPLISTGNGSLMPHAMLTAFGACGALVVLDGKTAQKIVFCLIVLSVGLASLTQMPFSEMMGGDYGRRSFYADYWVGVNGLDQMWTLMTGLQSEITVSVDTLPSNWEPGKAIGRKTCATICNDPHLNGPFKDCLDLGAQPEGRQILCSELKRKSFGYYHYRPQLTPLLMALCLTIYLFFAALKRMTASLWPLWIVGRRSLGVYVLHLALVALTTLLYGSNKPFESGNELHACFALILFACYAYAFWREKGRLFAPKAERKEI